MELKEAERQRARVSTEGAVTLDCGEPWVLGGPRHARVSFRYRRWGGRRGRRGGGRVVGHLDVEDVAEWHPLERKILPRMRDAQGDVGEARLTLSKAGDRQH